MEKMELVNTYSRSVSRLPADVYASITNFIVSKLRDCDEVFFRDLLDEALESKSIKFNGEPGWCLIQVKRDLEARGMIIVNVGKDNTLSQTIKLNRKKRSLR
jgi:hypothetical protein